MKLIQTGQWSWRQDELSMKQFGKLSSTDRQEYLALLLGLEENERSTNDLYILNKFAPESNKEPQFLEL